MFPPVPIYIGLRYLRFKQTNRSISLINAVAILSITLSITALLTTLSVLNGFEETVQTKIFNTSHHVTLQDLTSLGLKNWSQLRTTLLRIPRVSGVAPFMQNQGLLLSHQQTFPIFIYGTIPALEDTITSLSKKILIGHASLEAGKNQILLGEKLAFSLNLTIGSHIKLLVVNSDNNAAFGVTPNFQEFVVRGIVKTNAFGMDHATVYVHLKDMQDLYKVTRLVSGLHIKTTHLYDAPDVMRQLEDRFPKQYRISNWQERYGNLMLAINLEKTIMFCALTFLITIASFNLVSLLMMMVADKRSDIAILRTLGASSFTILSIFMIQGSITGLTGTVFGLFLGVLLGNHIGSVINFLESLFHFKLFTAPVYLGLYQLPSKVEWSDVWQVGIATTLITLFATFYPAWKASQVVPAEALRYE